jgi:hypothetical protein
MPYSVAKAWAQLRWPDIDFSPLDDFIPGTIEHYHRRVYPNSPVLRVFGINRYGESYCLFARHYVNDPTATGVKFKRIREREEDKKFVWDNFSREVAAKEVLYATISDPYEVHDTYRRESVIRVHTVKLPQES